MTSLKQVPEATDEHTNDDDKPEASTGSNCRDTDMTDPPGANYGAAAMNIEEDELDIDIEDATQLNLTWSMNV